MNAHREEDRLSTAEKIQKLQDQWDEISDSPEDLDLTPEQIEELHRRLRDHHLGPRHYKTWEEVRAELEAVVRHDCD